MASAPPERAGHCPAAVIRDSGGNMIAMTVPPPWVDDLYDFPTPPALARLIDIAWEHAFTDEGVFDDTLLSTCFDFMFELAAVPSAPQGWEEAHPGRSSRSLHVPIFATPEFVPFGALGSGIDVGWLVPAPELRQGDHPVVLAGGDEPGVTVIGVDTRAGLECMLSQALEGPDPQPPAGSDPQAWLSQHRWLLDARARERHLADRLAAALIEVPPDRQYPATSWDGTAAVKDAGIGISFDVPKGWRHEPGCDGIGVLAPADAFAADGPVACGTDSSSALFELSLTHAADLLDSGYPATALLGLKDTFFHAPSDSFADLKPLWARAYRDLGRPRSATRLDLMQSMYAGRRR